MGSSKGLKYAMSFQDPGQKGKVISKAHISSSSSHRFSQSKTHSPSHSTTHQLKCKAKTKDPKIMFDPKWCLKLFLGFASSSHLQPKPHKYDDEEHHPPPRCQGACQQQQAWHCQTLINEGYSAEDITCAGTALSEEELAAEALSTIHPSSRFTKRDELA